MNWINKTALITGGSRGIGAAIVKFMGQRGAKIIATGTSKSSVELINQLLDTHQIEGQAIELNLADPDSITNFFNYLNDYKIVPDILVNNAGVTADNLFLRMQSKDWQKVIDVNLTGAYRMISGCLRGMLKNRWGRIINLASVVGFSGNPGQANYCASKAGIIGLTKSLAQELGSRNITVNAVSPGFIETDMTKELTQEQQAKLKSQIPLARIGSVDDIAHAVAFLASPLADYITGETIHVNGGMYMA